VRFVAAGGVVETPVPEMANVFVPPVKSPFTVSVPL
jgi:hypothetical protein